MQKYYSVMGLYAEELIFGGGLILGFHYGVAREMLIIERICVTRY